MYKALSLLSFILFCQAVGTGQWRGCCSVAEQSLCVVQHWCSRASNDVQHQGRNSGCCQGRW